MLRWSPTLHRRIEAIRDKIFRSLGTAEPLIETAQSELASVLHEPRARHWRKPLSLSEINRMAPTPEVRERKGRP